jgi:5-methylcytosine-specific restriction endonuclease McrA
MYVNVKRCNHICSVIQLKAKTLKPTNTCQLYHNSIARVGLYSMNHYYTSQGDKISKSRIDALVRNAKKKALQLQYNEHGYNFCSHCLRSSGVYLDCSHRISVDQAQKTRHTELAYDVNNIDILCRQCHQQRDGLNLWHNEHAI